MAIDLKRTYSSSRIGRPLSSGTVVEQEGLIMVHRLEDGIEKAHIAATVAATDIAIGWSQTADSQPDRTSFVEDVTVPNAPATLEVDLRNQNLVVGRVRAVTSAGVALTIDPVFAGATAAGTVKVDHPTGRMKFEATQAGDTIAVTYLYDITLVESKQKFGERFVNNRGLHAEHGFIELANGLGELWTDQFDASLDWTAGTAITLGNAGQITQGGVGPVLDAIVIHAPNVDNAYLGIRVKFTA